MAYKSSDKKRNSQDGFVLVAAIIAVMILMAVGVYALTSSSQDIRAATRSVSEANALSAAESGVHTLLATFDPLNLADRPKAQIIPKTGSANSSYQVMGQIPLDDAPAPGHAQGWAYAIHGAQVTGFDNMLNGQVTLGIGIAAPIAVPTGPTGP